MLNHLPCRLCLLQVVQGLLDHQLLHGPQLLVGDRSLQWLCEWKCNRRGDHKCGWRCGSGSRHLRLLSLLHILRVSQQHGPLLLVWYRLLLMLSLRGLERNNNFPLAWEAEWI
jgi:hypothetical protein